MPWLGDGTPWLLSSTPGHTLQPLTSTEPGYRDTVIPAKGPPPAFFCAPSRRKAHPLSTSGTPDPLVDVIKIPCASLRSLEHPTSLTPPDPVFGLVQS